MDPNAQQNPGQFMNPQGTGQPGQGSALLRLMQLRNLGATPQAGATPLPAAPVQTGSPIPGNPWLRQATMAASQAEQNAAGTSDVAPSFPTGSPQLPSGGGSMAPVAPGAPTTFDPHGEALKIATQALANYIGNHGKALEAQHEVPRKTAEAKLIVGQAQPPASPVS